MGASKRRRIEPTHDWQLLLPLFEWPEQERYEEIRPLMLFDVSVAERAREVGASASTLYRRLDRFARGRHGVPLRRPGRQAQEAAARREAPHRGPQGRVPRLQPQRDSQRKPHGLRQEARRPFGGTGARRGARAAEDREELPTLPRGPGRSGGPGGHRGAAALRLERQGHSRLLRGPPRDRLPGFGEWKERGGSRA
jgi:hypothetical protein